MIFEQIGQHWDRWKYAAKEQWLELTTDDLEAIAGRREALESKLQLRYGITANQAAQRVGYWLRVLEESAGDDSRDDPQNFARGA
jgi:uncharacterized protein YjbJ (UPF0337 family)